MLFALRAWVEIAAKVERERERVKVRESLRESMKCDKRCETLAGVEKNECVMACWCETENIKNPEQTVTAGHICCRSLLQLFPFRPTQTNMPEAFQTHGFVECQLQLPRSRRNLHLCKRRPLIPAQTPIS